MLDKNESRINLLKGLLSTRLLFLNGLAISLLSLSSLSSSGIFEHAMAQQQHNMVLAHVAFSSLMYSYASTLINNNNSSSTTVIPAETNNTLYNNSTYGIKFQFPYGWNKIEILAGRTTLIDLTSPLINATGGLERPANVVISIEKGLENVTTLQQYSEAVNKFLNIKLGNFTPTTQPTTLSGLPAISKVITMKHPVSGIDIVIAQVFAIENNNAYSITYTVPASNYYRYLPMVQQIFNSFQITK
jgi:hypothetical protein